MWKYKLIFKTLYENNKRPRIIEAVLRNKGEKFMLPVFRTSYKVAKLLRQGGIVIRVGKWPRKQNGESMSRTDPLLLVT